MPELEVPLDQADFETYKKARTEEAVTEAPKEEPKPVAVTEAAKSEEEDEEKPKFKGGFQKRIDKLTREKYELLEKLNQAQAKQLEREPLAPKAVEAVKAARPKSEDYPTPEDWIEAVADWKATEKFETLSAKAQEQAQTEHNETHLQEMFQAHVKRVEAAREKYTDYDEVVDGIDSETDEIPNGLALTIVELDNGPDVAYHLAKNPELVSKLKEMSEYRAIAEIGKISDKLTPKTEEAPAEKKKTAAPAPIKPVATGNTKSAVPLDEMSFEDYKKARQQGRTA